MNDSLIGKFYNLSHFSSLEHSVRLLEETSLTDGMRGLLAIYKDGRWTMASRFPPPPINGTSDKPDMFRLSYLACKELGYPT